MTEPASIAAVSRHKCKAMSTPHKHAEPATDCAGQAPVSAMSGSRDPGARTPEPARLQPLPYIPVIRTVDVEMFGGAVQVELVALDAVEGLLLSYGAACAAAEREACAKLCDVEAESECEWALASVAERIAAAIRARAKK